MLGRWTKPALVAAAALTLAGCASISPQEAFLAVADDVEARTGARIQWDSGSQEDLEARETVKALLSRPLTPASAVRIALLNNRELRAVYTSLGLAQADLVQAGLLSNPVLDGVVNWPEAVSTGTPELALGIGFRFIEILWIPLKQRIAESQLEEAKIQVAGAAIDVIGRTHLAFVDHVAAEEEVILLKQVVKSARASVAAAKAIREAGNATALDFEQQQALLTSSKLLLAAAQARVAETREALNVLMGLTGGDTSWRATKRLKRLPAREIPLAGIEQRAVKASLELAGLRQQLNTLVARYGLTVKQAILPDLDVGVEAERAVEVVELDPPEDGGEPGTETEITWRVGPTFGVALPLFDQGQAKKARAIMMIRDIQSRYWAAAVRIRSAARLARASLLTARKTVQYYRKALLPQTERVLRETQRQYNAMQEGVFRLIRAKRDRIEAGRGFIGALQTYWRARIAIRQLLSGRMPPGGGGMAVAAAAPAGGGGGEGGH